MRTWLTLLIVALVTAACGGADTGAPADDPDPGSSPTTDPQIDPPTTEPPLGAGPYPIAELEVIVEHPDHPTLTYTVTCLGDTATVSGDDVAVNEQAACEALARAEVASRLVDGPPEDRVCTQEYGGPDTAAITGTIDEQPVNTTVDRTDGCGISDWDELLDPILPPARGAA